MLLFFLFFFLMGVCVCGGGGGGGGLKTDYGKKKINGTSIQLKRLLGLYRDVCCGDNFLVEPTRKPKQCVPTKYISIQIQ